MTNYKYTTLSTYCNNSEGCANKTYGLLSTYNYNQCAKNRMKESFKLRADGPTHAPLDSSQLEDYAFRVGVL